MSTAAVFAALIAVPILLKSVVAATSISGAAITNDMVFSDHPLANRTGADLH
ncbi:hypothetical protein MGAST_05560 [Mycobacterium gastri 'Wayne']|nr:hypothetical protein MGAST_05560 [Mycobacterium gastri 'Wayne']